jgi:plasmid stability protein
MATLTIRDVSDEVLAEIRRIARDNRRSMAQQLRVILEERVREEERRARRIEALRRMQAFRKGVKRRSRPGEIDRWIREGRP